MKRFLALFGMVSALALSAQANIMDFNNDPGSGYTRYFNGQGRRALDDVSRDTSLGLLAIKQINISVFNNSGSAADATLYVYDTDTSTGRVGTLLYTATIANVPTGVSQLLFGTPPIAAGVPDLWIGLSFNANLAGMILSPNPNPTIGSSADLFAWDQNANSVIDTNEYFVFGGTPPPVANFAIQVLAVPEPASMVALGAGLAGLLGLRRRTR